MESSSQFAQRWTYDVYVSFRGEDIRKNFVDHLFSDFRRKGIHAFREDDQLKRGEHISSELYRAIEQSRFLIVIFSSNYAFSTRCLRELVKILDCRETDKDKYEVRTIFYNVKPAVVRNQTGSYEEAFNKLEASDRMEVPKWKEALTIAANLSGWDLQDMSNGYESKFIDKISKEIFYKLTDGPLHVGDNLVGLYSRAEQMNLLRFVDSSKVHMIGICGVGGIGKTTIAKAIYNLLHIHFEGYSFCEDVKGVEDRHGLVHLQEKLLDELMKAGGLKIQSVGLGISIMKRRMGAKKVLLVLDDIDHYNQIEALAGSPNWFRPGSMIIVTGRDRQLLNAHGVEEIYEVDPLYDDEALELFSLYAFKVKQPKEEFIELANRVVQYVNGLPRALKVLGRFLFGKTLQEWASELDKLERYPNQLGLDFDQRNIFLDIACFFKGERKDHVMKILDGCQLFSATNLRVLVDKSLVTKREDRLQMRDLVQAWKIIHEESEVPGKRSRLWFPTDDCNILNKDKGTASVKCLAQDMSSSEVNICGKAFSKLNNLRLLHLYIASWSSLIDIHSNKSNSKLGNKKVKTSSKGLELLSTELRFLCWHGYPFQHLPSTFYPKNLVILDMSYSSIKQVWNRSKAFRKLRVIKLSHCHNLTKTPDLTEVPNLKELLLDGCENLVEVDPSVGILKRLIVLNLKNCKSLRSLPSTVELESLEILNLSGCSKLDKLPEDLGKMKALLELRADGTAIKQLPSSVSSLCNVQVLSLGRWETIQSKSWSSFLSPSSLLSIVRLRHPPSLSFPSLLDLHLLRNLDVSHSNLPEASLNAIACLSLLEILNLSGNNFTRLPARFSQLSRLQTLGLVGCKKIEALPELPPNIQLIEAQDCISLQELPKRLTMYKSSRQCFDFTNCTKVTENQTVESLVTMLLPQGRIDPYNLLTVLLPGSRIPGWFSNQSVGDCIKVELPPDWCYDKFKGIAICFVFTPRTPNGNKYSYNSVGYKFINFDGDPIGSEFSMPDSIFPYETIQIESDQMILCYHKSEPAWKEAKNFIMVSFKVYGKECKVTKCGARLVCEEDEQQHEESSSRMIHWLPTFPHAEDEQPPLKKSRVA